MGGMAELYLARAQGPFGFNKPCALKFALQHLAENPEFVAMFVHEARVLASLDHPNIAQVLDVGEFEGGPYFAMQYVDGRDLRQVMKALRGQPVELSVALRIASRVAAGLAYAHARVDGAGQSLGIVHRDVSPANVMLSYQGHVKLVDFGVAKSTVQDETTRRGVIKGKTAYLSPEQARGSSVDHRTDVFALGILLFETTTGRRLFRGDGDFELLRKVVEGDFPSPHEVCDDYPDELAAIVMHALQVEPDDRYQSAGALRHDLEAFARKYGILASELDVAAMMTSLFDVPSQQAAPEAASNAAETVALPTNPLPAASATGLARESSDEEPSTSQTRLTSHPVPLEVVHAPRPSSETVVAASGSHTQIAATPSAYEPRGSRNTILAAVAIAVSVLGLTWAYRSTPQPAAAAPQPSVVAAPAPQPGVAVHETPAAPARDLPAEPVAIEPVLEVIEPVPDERHRSTTKNKAPPPSQTAKKKKKKRPQTKTKPRSDSKDREGLDSMFP